jgi:NADH dehydrogenase
MNTPSATTTKPHVIIAGAGFAGVRAALQLCRSGLFQVTIITPNDTFAYYPQFYHTATGGARSESALPLAELFAGCEVSIVRDSVASLDPDHQTLTTAAGQAHHYDELILALGSVTNYFGIKGLEEFSYDIKSASGAERFKAHLHKQLVDHEEPDLNYVIVGGGPTGVELAAALGDYLKRIVALHGVRKPKYTIELIEAAPRLLPRSPEDMAAKVQRRLEKLGVKVMTGATVEGETADGLMVSGQEIKSQTVVWTAGVANNPFFKANAACFTLAKNGRVEVDEHLETRPGVHVIGDNAVTPYGGMAQTAIVDANFAAADLTHKYRQQERPAYVPKPTISVIPVGGMWAAVLWGKVRIYGVIGWALRRAADLVAYHDIEHARNALRVWLQDNKHEDNCQTCSPETVIRPDTQPAHRKH